MRHLVTIAGPIGAGKSTVAELLGRRLAATGAATSLADLDEVAFAQRAQLDLPEFWRRAGVAHSGLVRSWFQAGAEAVIARGPIFESRSYKLLFDAAPDDARQHHVLLRVPFEIAVRRVATDPGRGPSSLSQDREFLRATHERFREVEQSLPHVDIEVDTSEMSAADVADRLFTLLNAIRRGPTRSNPPEPGHE